MNRINISLDKIFYDVIKNNGNNNIQLSKSIIPLSNALLWLLLMS